MSLFRLIKFAETGSVLPPTDLPDHFRKKGKKAVEKNQEIILAK